MNRLNDQCGILKAMQTIDPYDGSGPRSDCGGQPAWKSAASTENKNISARMCLSMLPHLRRGLLWALAACLPFLAMLSDASAAEVVPLRLSDCGPASLGARHLEVMLDRSGQLTPAGVQEAAFAPAAGDRLNFGIVEGAVWLRFALRTGAGCVEPLFLNLGNPFGNR